MADQRDTPDPAPPPGDAPPRESRLLVDLAKLVAGQGVSMALGLAAFAYLARVLGPTDFGTLEAVLAIAVLGGAVIESGTGTIAVRRMADPRTDPGALAASVVLARAGLALIVVPALVLGGSVLGFDATGQTLLGIVALGLVAVVVRMNWVLQGAGRMDLVSLAQPVRAGVFAGLVALLAAPGGLIVIGWIEAAALVAASVYLVAAQYRTVAPFRGPVRLRQSIAIVREGIAVGLSNLIWAFMLSAPLVLTAALAGTAEAGWLGASARLVGPAMTLSYLYHFNLYPLITRTVEARPAAWRRIMASSCRLVAWATLTGAAMVSATAGALMGLVFGQTFGEAEAALGVLVWLIPLRMLTGHARWSLVAAGHQRALLRAEVGGAVTLVLAGTAGASLLGAAGGAGALVLAVAVSGVLSQRALDRQVGGFGALSLLGRPLGAAALALAAAFGVGFGTPLGALAAGAVMLGGLIADRVRIREDLIRLMHAREAMPASGMPQSAAPGASHDTGE